MIVDPDDSETAAVEMWIVLEERPESNDGYVVVYDPQHGSWGIAEEQNDGKYILIVGGDSLAEALGGM